MTATQKITRRIQSAELDAEITKPKVLILAKAALAASAISHADFDDVCRILSDRDQCAEDALSELSSSVQNYTAPTVTPNAATFEMVWGQLLQRYGKDAPLHSLPNAEFAPDGLGSYLVVIAGFSAEGRDAISSADWWNTTTNELVTLAQTSFVAMAS